MDRVIFIRDEQKEPKDWTYIDLSSDKEFKRYYRHLDRKNRTISSQAKQFLRLSSFSDDEIFVANDKKEYTY